MWSTPDGDRVLSGHEAELVRETVGGMIDELELLAEQTSFPPLELGVPVWDGLTWQQKLATLDQVVRHLLQTTTSMLPQTAVYESAIGAIYAKIKCNIEVELDLASMEDDSEFHDLESWRTLVLLAFHQPRYLEGEFLVGESFEEVDQDSDDDHYPTCPDDARKELWFDVVERLADRILWDRDYEMEGVFGDIDPVQATALKNEMGVERGYFRSAAPDIHDEMVGSVIERVKAITHRPRPQIDDCDF